MRKNLIFIVAALLPLALIFSYIPAQAALTLPNVDCTTNPPSVSTGSGKSFVGLCNAMAVLNILIFILEFLLLVYFIYGVANYIRAGGDSQKMSDSKNIIIFGLVGLGVAFGVNFIINAIGGLVGISFQSPIPFFAG